MQKSRKILKTKDAVSVYKDIFELLKSKIKTKKALEKFTINLTTDVDEIKKLQKKVLEAKKIAETKFNEISPILENFELCEERKFFVERTIATPSNEIYEKFLPVKNYCELILIQNENIDEHERHIIFVEDIDEDINTLVPEIELSKFVFNKETIKKIKEIYKNLENDEFKVPLEIDDEIFLFNDKLELDTEELRKKRAFLKEFEKYALEEEEKINIEILKKVEEREIKIDGKRLLQMNVENISNIPELKSIIKEVIDSEIEKTALKFDLKKSELLEVFSETYPCKVNKEGVESLINKKKLEILEKEYDFKLKIAKKIKGKFEDVKKACDKIYDLDILLAIGKVLKEYDMHMPEISENFGFINGKNLFIENACPVTYSLGSEIEKRKVAILTGANSGGKTTLLKTILQIQILGQCGLCVPAEKAEIPLFEEIYFLSKYSGTLSAGAFESALRDIVKILTSKKRKLVLVDEL